MSIEDNYYPLLEDINFNYKLQNHPEFYQYKTDNDNYILENMEKMAIEKCNESGGYIYKKIQMLVSSFLSLHSPYNGLLLYHGVGVGKSCSSVLIADNFKEYVKKHNKKIIILTKKTVKDGFKKEIFKFDTDKIDKNQFTCTSNEYNNFYDDFIKNNNDIDEKKIKDFTSGIINEYYEIYGYIEFANKYDKLIKTNNTYNKNKINEQFSNCIFIIDEIHNLRDENDADEDDDDENKSKIKSKTMDEAKKSRVIIQNIISNLNDPIKLILLSATPMYDKYDEIEFIINLLLSNDKKPLLNKSTINNYIDNNDESSMNLLLEKTRGYISYIKGNDPHIFPLILYPENNTHLLFETKTQPVTNNKVNAILCLMNDYQKNVFTEQTKNTTRKKYSNIVFPNESTFSDLFNEEKVKHFSYKNEDLCKELLNNISNYSIKLHTLLENLKNSIGKVFIYSEYINGNYAGNDLLGIVLEHYGYFRKTISKNNLIVNNILTNTNNTDIKGYYVMVDGSTKEEDFTFYKENYNNNNNINGENIKIIIGTTNMIEGVSLNNVRQIHVMQPWYNISRNEQIVGRGVRQCSHIKLPFDLRNITIFNYVAISEDLDSNDLHHIVPFTNPKTLDIDLRRLQLTTDKITKISLLEDLLKKNSIDCILNKNINSIKINEVKTETPNIIIHKDSYNQKRLISYTNDTEIKCTNSEDSPIKDNTIYNYQLKTFTNKNLKKNTKYFIKSIFTKGILRKLDEENINKLITYQENKVYFNYNELFNELKFYNTEITEDLFKLSLQDLILNKELFYDKFNKSGYIILKGVYFIFKNNTFENIHLPFEFSQYPFNNKIKNISNYKYYSITHDLQKTPGKKSNTPKSTTTTSSTTKTTSSTKKSSQEPEPVNPEPMVSMSQNAELIDELLSECKNNGLIESLKDISVYKKYNNLWSSKLSPTTTKKGFGLTKYNNIDLDKISKTDLYKSIFEILFNTKKNKTEITNKNKELYDLFYNNLTNIHFIFNYSSLIQTYLKCLFYRVHIQNEKLNNNEQMIYDYYSNLIHSTNPLIFKFIDFYKDDLSVYIYDNIGIIYYEFDTTNNTWITHNLKYKSFNVTIDSLDNKLTLYKIFPHLISTKYSPFLTNKTFIMEQLKIDEFDFNRIYNTFNHNNYYNHNNTYFKYSGDPSDPFKNTISDTKKLSNIVGTIIINSSNSKVNLVDLSRNIFTLGTIYSLHKNNKNIYFKTGANTGYTNIDLPKRKGDKLGVSKIKHLLYCILDQVEELNYKLILETILDKEIDTLWNTEEDLIKYKIKDFFDTIDITSLQLDDELYNNLNSFLTSLDEPLDTLDKINNNLKINNYKLYTHIDTVYDILTHSLNETTIISVTTYLLYSLDKYYHNDKYRSFYNKRWLFSLFESSLLNAKVLNIELVGSTQVNQSKSNRIADSASLTKNTFLLSKALSKKETTEYNDLDK